MMPSKDPSQLLSNRNKLLISLDPMHQKSTHLKLKYEILPKVPVSMSYVVSLSVSYLISPCVSILARHLTFLNFSLVRTLSTLYDLYKEDPCRKIHLKNQLSINFHRKNSLQIINTCRIEVQWPLC